MVKTLDTECWGITPGQYFALSDSVSRDAEKWVCVREYPPASYYCPFCSNGEFEWIDGDTSVYSGDGNCTNCGAEVSFQDAGTLTAS